MIGRILIADDSATARMFIKRCLEMCGYQDAEITEAENGLEAFNLLKKSRVDLVITDLNMPEMDGRELLQKIRTSPRLFDLPVLVITSADNPALTEELTRLGALAILGKPISPPVLAEALSNLGNDDEWGA